MLRSLVFFLFSAHTLAAPFHTSKSSTQLSQSAIGGQWHYRRATSTMPCYALTHLRLTEPIVPGQVGSTTYNAAFLGAGTSGCVYGLSKAGSDQILAVAKYEPNMGALKREQSSLKQVDQYYGEFEAHGQHFVVMKYISGVLIEETDGYKKSCGPGKGRPSPMAVRSCGWEGHRSARRGHQEVWCGACGSRPTQCPLCTGVHG